jgi:hypothetical protein
MKKKQKPVVKPEKKKGAPKEKSNGASFDEIVGALLKVPHKLQIKER